MPNEVEETNQGVFEMNEFTLLTDRELSDVFNHGVPFTVHKRIVKGGMDSVSVVA